MSILERLARLTETLIEKRSPDERTKPTSASSPPSRIQLHVQINRYIAENKDGEEDEFTEHFEVIPNPSESIVQAKVHSIDWTDATRRPTIALAHADEGKVHNLRIKGTLGTPNIDGQMRVYWLGPGNDRTVFVRSPPLNCLDEGIELLLMFLHDETRLMAKIDLWEPAESPDDIE
jgi:hypothetical protein